MKHTMKMMQSCSLCVQMTPGLMIEISYIINDLLWWLNCLPCLITELEGCYLVTPVFVYSVYMGVLLLVVKFTNTKPLILVT